MIEPDSMTFAVMIWILGLLITLFVALRGHAFGTRSLKHVAMRLGGMLTSTFVLVLAAVVTLNSKYGWYSSWQDVQAAVTGTPPTIEQHTHGKARTQEQKNEALQQARQTDAAADAKYAAQRARYEAGLHLKPSSTGQWIKINIPGIRMQGKDIGRVMVWLPPSYTSDTKRTYPVIEAFHGMPGGTLDYQRVFHLDASLRDAVSRGAMRDAIIIVPQEMPAGIDTECVDGGGLNMETWLTSMVPDHITKNFRAQASREAWTTIGVSAGGWCSSMATILHPDRYAGGASLGGYYSPQFATWNPFKGKVPERYDLIAQVKKNPHPQSLWVLVSGADKLSGASSEAFIKAATAYDVTQVDLPHAGHRVGVWQSTFPDVFTWMGKTFPMFAASAGSTSQQSASPSPSSSPSAPSSQVQPSASSLTRRHRALTHHVTGSTNGLVGLTPRTRG